MLACAGCFVLKHEDEDASRLICVVSVGSCHDRSRHRGKAASEEEVPSIFDVSEAPLFDALRFSFFKSLLECSGCCLTSISS